MIKAWGIFCLDFFWVWVYKVLERFFGFFGNGGGSRAREGDVLIGGVLIGGGLKKRSPPAVLEMHRLHFSRNGGSAFD
jgi:hypothetical protein